MRDEEITSHDTNNAARVRRWTPPHASNCCRNRLESRPRMRSAGVIRVRKCERALALLRDEHPYDAKGFRNQKREKKKEK